MELQRDYQGLIPRILSILNLFGDNDKISALIKLEDKSIVTSGIMRLFTYADLQNPLLIKYDFDPVDFMEGMYYNRIDIFASLSHSIKRDNNRNGS